MNTQSILKTENTEWGFFGASTTNGYANVEALWSAMSLLLIEVFEISPEHARRVLDSRFGRHLSDELSFIKGKLTPETAASHVAELLKDYGWRRYFRDAIRDARN